MATRASFAYNGTNTMTAYVTGATVGHTIGMYVQDDLWASAEFMVAPSESFVFVYPASIGVTINGQTRIVFAWNQDDNDAIIGTSVFALDSGNTAPYNNQVTWYYDGVSTVTATFDTVAGLTYGLDTFVGDYNQYQTVNGVSSGGPFTLQETGATQTEKFAAEVYTQVGPYNSWGSRIFTPGIAGSGVQGNPSEPFGSVIVTLDSVDVTECCVGGNWTRRLNRPSTAQIRVPMDCATAAVGTLLKIEALVGSSYEIVHHGRVLLVETDTGEDFGYTTYNSTDPMELWQWRPVRDDTCDFTVPTIIDDYVTGPQIMEAALENTVYCGGSSPASTEGPIFLDMGVFDTGGVDLTGAPTDWPMTIAELASLLISTGELDLVITPTDPGGGIMGTIDGYNGDYGTDLSASIVFSYGMGDFNVRRMRWNQDMTTMTNKLWYYAGPRVLTAADPAGDQHWNYNITGDDPAFNPDGNATGAWVLATSYVDEDPGPADTVTNGGVSYICIGDNAGTANSEPGVGALWQQFWTVLMVPPGGRSSPTASATDNQLGVLRIASQGSYGVRMDIQIFDAYDETNAPNRDLFRKRWQQEAWLRAQPREIIHITPTRETEIGTFDIGDLVGVEATSAVRGGFTGAQRVYEYTVSWDNDGVLELSELQTSADNEGL